MGPEVSSTVQLLLVRFRIAVRTRAWFFRGLAARVGLDFDLGLVGQGVAAGGDDGISFFDAVANLKQFGIADADAYGLEMRLAVGARKNNIVRSIVIGEDSRRWHDDCVLVRTGGNPKLDRHPRS